MVLVAAAWLTVGKALLQGLEAHTVRACAFFTQALLLVGFVLLVVAVEERPLAVAFGREDMGGLFALIKRKGGDVGSRAHIRRYKMALTAVF